ncbi:PREDICTED: transcription repressor OFP17-like [Ipomoea nil]|uniref:transcription repressor OFP17-like n=1 Tax=Ipomoea nil TaxID=35883 RepID=UPI000900E112|nr:PREDICTED: transcription repressor OFP17-like [Ipomoea nil]
MKLITPSCKRFIFTPFKKMLRLFKFRLRKSLSVGRRLRRPRQRRTAIRRSIFRYLPKAREDDDEAMELKSFSDTTTTNQKAPFPSPLTPAYVRMIAEAGNGRREDGRIPDEVDGGDACRRFEKCLAGIVAGEGRMAARDLMDVEDLVYCWENLRCPVFLDLVCRFYRELCKDVFSDNVDPKIELHLKNPNRNYFLKTLHKLNVDASIDFSRRCIGFGWVVRDVSGEFVAAEGVMRKGVFSTCEAEAVGVREALN